MGLQVECPGCRTRNSLKARFCKCGNNLAKDPNKVFWISYYDVNKKLRRERIGLSKAAAEQRLRECLTARAEGRYVKKCPDTVTRFNTLASWYLSLPEVKAKRSYERDKVTVKLLLTHFGDKMLSAITPATVEAFRQTRLATPSGRTPTTLVKPASVNRECAGLRSIFNRAIKNGLAEKNPCSGVKLLRENNVRDRILSPEEYTRLLAHCPAHLTPIVRLAYHTGMRRGEILGLTWGQVDLQGGFIKLAPEDTKTNDPRLIPLNAELLAMLRAMPQGLPGVHVFRYLGEPMGLVRRAFLTACAKAGITDFTFHDLRHTWNTNAYKAGVPIPTIMKITGHKSMSMFMRYTAISAEDLKAAINKI